MKTIYTMLFLIVAASVPAVGAAPASATLRVLPDQVLPGLPPSFLVTLANDTDVAQTLTNDATLTVTVGQTTFHALGIRGADTIAMPADQVDRCGDVACVTLSAHSRREIYFDAGPLLSDNEFFADSRLSQPGQYDLSMAFVMVDAATGDAITISSNHATLTIATPTGNDLAVWQTMTSLAAASGWNALDWSAHGPALAKTIRSQYANSRYAAWVGGFGNLEANDEAIAHVDEALASSPPESVRDDLLLRKGLLLAHQSKNAIETARNADTGLSLAERARGVFLTLKDVAVSNFMRQRAATELGRLYTRRTAEDTLRMLASFDPPAPAQLVPRVECVAPGLGSTFTARFGYTNPNQVIKVVPLGAENQITPAPRGDAQPRVFQPGDHANVFEASSPGGVLTWHLDRNVATATADFGVRCVESAP
jgi:hypothetical protein